MKKYFVYIMGNNRPTLYVGVTNDLVRRVYQHKKKLLKGFTEKYGLDKLLYFEEVSDIHEALRREKRLKRWDREWKLQLIEKSNPDFSDLYDKLIPDLVSRG